MTIDVQDSSQEPTHGPFEVMKMRDSGVGGEEDRHSGLTGILKVKSLGFSDRCVGSEGYGEIINDLQIVA